MNSIKTLIISHHPFVSLARGAEYTEFVFFFYPIGRRRSGKSHSPSGKVAYVAPASIPFGQIERTYHLMGQQKDRSVSCIAGLRILHHRGTEYTEAEIPYRLKLPQSGSPNA